MVSVIIWKTSVRMTLNYHAETPLNQTRTCFFPIAFIFYTIYHFRQEGKKIILTYLSKIFLSRLFGHPVSQYWHIKRHFEVGHTVKKKRKKRQYLLLKRVSYMFEVRCDWLEFIHKFSFSVSSFSCPASLRSHSLCFLSQMLKNCETNSSNMGKFFSWAFD